MRYANMKKDTARLYDVVADAIVINGFIAAACLAVFIGGMGLYGAIAERVVLRKNERLEREFADRRLRRWGPIVIRGGLSIYSNIVVRDNRVRYEARTPGELAAAIKLRDAIEIAGGTNVNVGEARVLGGVLETNTLGHILVVVTNDAGERWTWEPFATNNIIRK